MNETTVKVEYRAADSDGRGGALVAAEATTPAEARALCALAGRLAGLGPEFTQALWAERDADAGALVAGALAAQARDHLALRQRHLREARTPSPGAAAQRAHAEKLSDYERMGLEALAAMQRQLPRGLYGGLHHALRDLADLYMARDGERVSAIMADYVAH